MIWIEPKLTPDERDLLLSVMGEPQWWWTTAERNTQFWLELADSPLSLADVKWTSWEVTHMWRLLESRYHGHWNRPEYELMSRLRRLVNVDMNHRGRAAGQDVRREFVSRKLSIMPGARI